MSYTPSYTITSKMVNFIWKDVFVVMPTESIVRDKQDKYYKALENSGNSQRNYH